MSDKIGGISIDDIMDAAISDLEENNETKVEKKDVKQINEPEEIIGGINIGEIMNAAREDLENDEYKPICVMYPQNEDVETPKPDEDVETPKAIGIHDKKSKNKDDNIKDGPPNNISGDFVSALRKLPFIDLIYRAVKQKNWGLLIWLVLNLFVIGIIFSGFGSLLFSETLDEPISSVIGFIIGIVLYFATLAVALSAVGEFILRQQNSCRKIKDKNIKNKIEPIFKKVYDEAKIKNPELSNDIKLFMCDDESANAFATGKRTVCITRGLADMDDEHIAGILAHEFGHLANKDTDCILMVFVANLILTVITFVFGTIINFVANWLRTDEKGNTTTVGMGIWIALKVSKFLYLTVPLFIWTKIGVLLCLRGNRKQEYAADYYAAELGYAQQLMDAFVEIEDAPRVKGLWRSLVSSHPDTADRVMKLNEYLETQNSTIR